MKTISCLLLFTVFLHILSFSQERTEINFPVNQPDAMELVPSISLDGKTLIYVSNVDGTLKLYESNLNEDNTWSTPKSIEAINQYVNAKTFIGSSSLSYNGNTLYFCANFFESAKMKGNNNTDDENIYYSKRIGNEWGEPINIGSPINTEDYDATPSISADEKTIFFVRTNKKAITEGYQCKKIFYSEKDSLGNWQTPVPLPVTINLDCEQSPRICADGRTLMFSSVRAGNIGKADLFFSKKIAKYSWSEPVPMLFANTVNSDQYVSIVATGDNIYYSIREYTKEKQLAGIYTMFLPEEYRPYKTTVLQGKIVDYYTNKPISATLKISDASTTDIIYELNNNETDGSYSVVLTEGRNYFIDIFKDDNYSHVVMQYNLKDLKKCELIKKDIPLYSKISLNINVFDNVSFKSLESKFKIVEEKSGNEINTQIKEASKGRYLLDIPIGKKYKITTSANHYSSSSFDIDLTSIIMFDQISRTVELTPITKRVYVKVDDITNADDISVKSNDKKQVYKVKKDAKDKYYIELREGEHYDVTISANGYSFYNTNFDLTADTVQQTIETKLIPLVKDMLMMLNDITFESNSAELNINSYSELDRAVTMLLDNTNVRVEISAHTDNVGADDYNLKLSNRRAQTVADYMYRKGIAIDRIVPKGFGESMPIVPNDTDENKAKNRRVQIKIL